MNQSHYVLLIEHNDLKYFFTARSTSKTHFFHTFVNSYEDYLPQSWGCGPAGPASPASLFFWFRSSIACIYLHG